MHTAARMLWLAGKGDALPLKAKPVQIRWLRNSKPPGKKPGWLTGFFYVHLKVGKPASFEEGRL